MLQPVRSTQLTSINALHTAFLVIVPSIERHGRICFRDLKCPDARQEVICEMVALCWQWFRRLAHRGKDGSRFPTVLARYAARHVRAGRRLCGREPAQDIMAPAGRRRHGFARGTLHGHGTMFHRTVLGNSLADVLYDNTRTPPPEAAAFRCDFPAWRQTRCERDRRLIDALMQGERTGDLAKAFGLTAARVSQLRREFHDDWRSFCDEPSVTPCQPANSRPTERVG
jgi:hypothetical protein